MILVPASDWPQMWTDLYFEGGSREDPPGKEGLTWLTAQLCLRGTMARERDDFRAAVETLGGHLDVIVGRARAIVTLEGLSRNARPLLMLMAETLSTPRLCPEELERLRRQTIADIEERKDRDEDLAWHLFEQALLSPDPAAPPSRGTTESIARVTIDDVKAHAVRLFSRARMQIAAAGDIDENTIRGVLDECLDLPEGDGLTGHVFAPDNPGSVKLVLVDKPQRAQCQVVVGHSTIACDDPDYLALEVAQTIFGGTFSSRLSQEIREKRGWSYSAHASLIPRRGSSSFTYRFHPATEDTAAAVALSLELLADFWDNGVDEDEVAFAIDCLANQHPFRRDTPRRDVDERMRARVLSLPEDYLDTYPERVRAVTPEAVDAAIRAHLKPNDLHVFVVGTASEIEAGLRAIDAVDDVTVHPFDREWPTPTSEPSVGEAADRD